VQQQEPEASHTSLETTANPTSSSSGPTSRVPAYKAHNLIDLGLVEEDEDYDFLWEEDQPPPDDIQDPPPPTRADEVSMCPIDSRMSDRGSVTVQGHPRSQASWPSSKQMDSALSGPEMSSKATASGLDLNFNL
jgi:hypothetical protein